MVLCRIQPHAHEAKLEWYLQKYKKAKYRAQRFSSNSRIYIFFHFYKDMPRKEKLISSVPLNSTFCLWSILMQEGWTMFVLLTYNMVDQGKDDENGTTHSQDKDCK